MTDRPSARVVLVHGTRLSHTQWSGYAGRLPGLQVVTPDLPGHGTAVGQAFSSDSALAAIEAAVEGGAGGTQGGAGGGGPAAGARGGPEPAAPLPTILVGHSLGGYLAQLYAERHPTRLAGLVIIGASAVPEGVGAAAYRGLARLIDRVGPDRWGRGADAVMRRVAGAAAHEAAMAGGASYEATQDAWATVMGECGPEGLHEVACPVVLLGGQLDQLHVHTRRYAACCRDPRVVRVPRATHLLPLTHPQVVARVIADLAEEVTGGATMGRS